MEYIYCYRGILLVQNGLIHLWKVCNLFGVKYHRRHCRHKTRTYTDLKTVVCSRYFGSRKADLMKETAVPSQFLISYRELKRLLWSIQGFFQTQVPYNLEWNYHGTTSPRAAPFSHDSLKLLKQNNISLFSEFSYTFNHQIDITWHLF